MKLLAITLIAIVIALFIFMFSFGITTVVWHLIGPQVLMASAAALTIAYLAFFTKERL